MARKDTTKACEKCGRELQARGFLLHVAACKGTGTGRVPSPETPADDSPTEPNPEQVPAERPAERSFRGRFRAT